MESHNIQLPFVTSHAFIIGINDYQHISRLNTAVNDAQVLAEQLAEQHRYTVHGPLLNAKREEILHFLEEELPNRVGEEDRLLFYFAGHGIALDSDDNPKGYLVPADAKPGESESLISMDLLHDKITQLPCKHGLLIMDCCFAGAFKWSTGFRDVVFDLPSIIYEERFYQYAQDPAWQVITSSASDQKAVDILSNRSLGMRSVSGARHSPFAQALLDGLAGEADTVPKEKGDGVITATELYTYLRDRVEDETTEEGKRQSPSMFSLQKHDKGQYIFLHPNHRLNLPPIPKQNPFMGLAAYSEEDAGLFYGRDRVIKALIEKTKEQNFVVVSGASGTGKSSVIKAGLLPLLRKQGWQILPKIRPGKAPMESLKATIPDLEAALKSSGSSILLIDQYEELITQCLYPNDRTAFEAQLLDWLNAYEQLHIIISIRSDFEPQFEEATLAKWWQKGRYVVPAFSLDELREVIIKPTVQEVLFFEPDTLVDKLVDAVNQAPGALPLLSFTLSELYHAYINSGRTNRAFTLEDYEKLGGVIGALRTRANKLYDELDRDHQDSMRKLMLRMVSLEGGELASRRVLEIDLQFKDTLETERIQKVAQQLVEARLISSGLDHEGRTYYEPAHDALVRAWARLWEWIRGIGEGKLSLLYKLSLAITDYGANKTQAIAKDYLWNDDPRLNLFLSDLQVKGHPFNAAEVDFLEASRDLRKREKQRRQWIIAAVITVLAGITAIAIWQWIKADAAANLATSNNLASQSILLEQTNPTIALRLAEGALQYEPDNIAALGALLGAFYVESEPYIDVFYQIENKFPEYAKPDEYPELMDSLNEEAGIFATSIGFSPTEKHVLGITVNSHSDDPVKLNLWDRKFEKTIASYSQNLDPNNPEHKKRINFDFLKAAFSKNEPYAVLPNGYTAEIWQLWGKQNQSKFVLGSPARVEKAIFDDNSARIFTQTDEGQVYAWNFNNRPIRLGERDFEYGLNQVFCDAAGKQFVLIGDDVVGIYDDQGKRIDPPGNATLSISEDRQSVLADDQLFIDLKSYIKLIALGSYGSYGKEGPPNHILPNEKYAIDINENLNDIIIRDNLTNTILVTLKGHDFGKLSALISPDERFIISASEQEIKFWDWNGNTFFSLDYGGQVNILPNGKTICILETAGWAEETGYLTLLSINPESILEWANKSGVYQLSQADRKRFGLQ